MNLLTFDPGRTTGWAWFTHGLLKAAGTEAIAGLAGRELSTKNIVADFVGEDIPGVVAVIEAPRWYPHEHKIDVNDLIDLAVLVGQLKEHCLHMGAQQVELVYPRTWKGTVPKPIHNRRVLDKLTDMELAVLPRRPRARDYDHNCVDAVGIGLWKLGRML